MCTLQEDDGRAVECSLPSELMKQCGDERVCLASEANQGTTSLFYQWIEMINDDEQSLTKVGVCSRSIANRVVPVLLSASAGFLFPCFNPLLHLGNSKVLTISIALSLVGAFTFAAHRIRKFVCRSVAWQTCLACPIAVYALHEFVRQSSNAAFSFGALELYGLAHVNHFFVDALLAAVLFVIPTATAFSWCLIGTVCCILTIKLCGVITPSVTESNIDPFFGGGGRRRPSAAAFEELRGQFAILARKLEESGTKPTSAKEKTKKSVSFWAAAR